MGPASSKDRSRSSATTALLAPNGARGSRSAAAAILATSLSVTARTSRRVSATSARHCLRARKTRLSLRSPSLRYRPRAAQDRANAMQQHGKNLTAFVLAGGGSLGAVQVGMLAALTRRGVVPDFVVGASVGAINAAYYAAEPDERGVERLKRIWLKLRRTDVFPFSPLASMLGFFGKTDHLVAPAPLRSLIESELPYQCLEDARLPCYVVATDALKGTEVVLSSGPAATALF